MEEFNFIQNNNNIDFAPESADFYTYKIFTNLTLLSSMIKIYNDNHNIEPGTYPYPKIGKIREI